MNAAKNNWLKSAGGSFHDLPQVPETAKSSEPYLQHQEGRTKLPQGVGTKANRPTPCMLHILSQ